MRCPERVFPGRRRQSEKVLRALPYCSILGRVVLKELGLCLLRADVHDPHRKVRQKDPEDAGHHRPHTLGAGKQAHDPSLAQRTRRDQSRTMSPRVPASSVVDPSDERVMAASGFPG
ncbi:MAG: hypothetical protein ACJAQ3_000596 [Planctomycetota bacterium]